MRNFFGAAFIGRHCVERNVDLLSVFPEETVFRRNDKDFDIGFKPFLALLKIRDSESWRIFWRKSIRRMTSRG